MDTDRLMDGSAAQGFGHHQPHAAAIDPPAFQPRLLWPKPDEWDWPDETSDELDCEEWQPAPEWELPELGRLTPRQRNVMRLMVRGEQSKKIALLLGAGLRTIEYDRTAISRALDIDANCLIIWAVQNARWLGDKLERLPVVAKQPIRKPRSQPRVRKPRPEPKTRRTLGRRLPNIYREQGPEKGDPTPRQIDERRRAVREAGGGEMVGLDNREPAERGTPCFA